MEAISEMLWPLLACFILVGIHAYLGIHVIARNVIFVDLALAQIAGLGAVYGVFIGLSFEANYWLIKIISVIFTLLGALLISLTRQRSEIISHEALIGIIYASALSLTVLLTSNLPHGSEEVSQMLAGSILWVRPFEVIQTAILYAAIGIFYYIFHERFLNYTKLWDFLFYATFGIVVTSSVSLGGVLLVFGYLVIPAALGLLLAQSFKSRLLIAWTCGLLVSIFGVFSSYMLNVPSGPAIVVLLALLLVAISLIKYKNYNFLYIMLAILVLIILIMTPFLINTHEENHVIMHNLKHHEEDENMHNNLLKNMLVSNNTGEILEALNNNLDKTNIVLVTNLLSHSDTRVRERAVQVIAQQKWHEGLLSLLKAFKRERDDFIRLEIAESVLAFGSKEGFSMLLELMRSKSELVRADALLHIEKWLSYKIKNHELIPWLKKHSDKLEFDEKTKKYYSN
jgi:zinc/manganese transport system permease protein